MQHRNSDYYTLLEQCIDGCFERTGTSPTVRELARESGLSPATVSRYLNDMRAEGTLDYDGHRSLVTRRMRGALGGSCSAPILSRAPVLGDISCGEPKFAESLVEDYVRLPAVLFGTGDFFILRAKGRSMINAGIEPGDYVFIRRQSYAVPGEIVVALLEDETTLKRFYPEPEKNRIRLQPENDEMEPIYVNSCIIQGVAVKVLKNLE